MKQKDRDIDHMLRLLDGSLSAEEESALRERMKTSESLREDFLDVTNTKQRLLEAADLSASDALKPFFTDRLMRRLNESSKTTSHQEDFATMLGHVFRPVALAGFLLAVCLAVYNIHLSKAYSVDTTTAESVLALPPVTSMAVFDLDLYASESVDMP